MWVHVRSTGSGMVAETNRGIARLVLHKQATAGDGGVMRGRAGWQGHDTLHATLTGRRRGPDSGRLPRKERAWRSSSE